METKYTAYRKGYIPPECNEWFGVVEYNEYKIFKRLANNIKIKIRSSIIYRGKYYSIFCKTTDDIQILRVAYFEEGGK